MLRLSGGRIEIRVGRVPRPFPPSVYAVTIWPFVFYESHVWDDVCVQIHERHHWLDQIKWLVIPWFVIYLLLSIKYGGARNHPFEKQAYAIQDDCNSSSPKPAPKS